MSANEPGGEAPREAPAEGEEERVGIRFYEPGDEEGILALFNAVFAEGDPAHRPRPMAHWQWQFGTCPAGRQIVVAEELDTRRIVAQYACLPVLCNLDGRTVCIGQGIDSVVHKDYRRALKREARSQRAASGGASGTPVASREDLAGYGLSRDEPPGDERH